MSQYPHCKIPFSIGNSKCWIYHYFSTHDSCDQENCRKQISSSSNLSPLYLRKCFTLSYTLTFNLLFKLKGYATPTFHIPDMCQLYRVLVLKSIYVLLPLCERPGDSASPSAFLFKLTTQGMKAHPFQCGQFYARSSEHSLPVFQ